jgi:predicted AlkP superfamily pyrophosphatase or phosphodiesterase
MSRAAAISLLALALAVACGHGDAAKPQQKKVAATKSAAKPALRPVTRPLLLVGLDGATWDLLDPLIAEGALPNFAKLVKAGAHGPLHTFQPTLSPLIWTTIATGVGPARHGIRGFTAPVPGKPGETAIVTSNMRRVEALWNVLSDEGITVGVVGWWATYPAESVNGFVISDQANDLRRESYRRALDLAGDGGAAAADPRAVSPPELGAEIGDALSLPTSITRADLGRFFELPADRDDLLTAEAIDDEDILSVFKFAYLIDASFLEAGARALEKRRPTFAAIYLNGLDAAEHLFWKYMDPGAFRGVPAADVGRYRSVIRNYYIYMDEALGRLLAAYPLDRAAVIVVSDHGQVPNAKYDPAAEDHFDRVCSGTHDGGPAGVILMAGKDVVAGADLAGASVFDVAPTALALMGAPVGADMPGRVLESAISPGFLKAHPIRKVPSLSKGRESSDAPIPSPMNDALQAKLKGLGYIE